jgi:outer membrane protein
MKSKFLAALLLITSMSPIVFAVDGMAVIDMRTAVLSTQVSQNAFKALESDADYSANVEKAQALQSERQALAERLQKEAETLSQQEIADIQRSVQEKSKDLEFIVGKIQSKQTETADKVFRDLNPTLQKILQELIAAKQVKVLLGKETVLFADQAMDLTDDVTSMLDVAAKESAEK